MKIRCGTGNMICKNVGKQNNTTQNRTEKQSDTFRHFFRVEWFLPAPYNKKGKTRKCTKNATRQDYEKFSNAVSDYLEVFQDMSQSANQQWAQTM